MTASLWVHETADSKPKGDAALGELVPEGYQRQAYDEAGKMTTDPNHIVCYSGDIIDFFPTKREG